MTYTFVKTAIFISAVFVLKCLADVCTLLWSMKAYTQNYLRVLPTVSLTHSISSMPLWKTISSFVLLCGYLGFVSFIFNLLGVAGLLEFVRLEFFITAGKLLAVISSDLGHAPAPLSSLSGPLILLIHTSFSLCHPCLLTSLLYFPSFHFSGWNLDDFFQFSFQFTNSFFFSCD